MCSLLFFYKVDQHEDKVNAKLAMGEKKEKKKKKKKDKPRPSGAPVSLDGLMDWTAKGL